MLRGKPRNATVKAGDNLECAVIDGKLFDSLKLGEKLTFAKRKAVQTFEETKEKVKGDTNKTEEEKELIRKAILANKKLNEILTDSKSNRHIIYKFMTVGFASLTLEELACTLVNPTFTIDFKKNAEEDWTMNYHLKALEKLK